ncbi:glycosyl hydrolase family 65 protein [Streptomyces pseudovenezuelae]|uniref:glycosyl hydrolase family 65 protein n=1 Tax=Streptomyces pseudovenezuelae TaxID=67350 RepID=UPI0036E42807
MAGTFDLVQRAPTGLQTRAGALWLDPVPLPELSSYGFSLRYQEHWGVQLRLERGRLDVLVPSSDADPIDIRLPGRAVVVEPGESVRLVLED